MSRRRRLGTPRALAAPLTLIVAALVATSCGGSGPDSSRLVEPDKNVLINSLTVGPGEGEFLLTTNRGFFRIRDGRAIRVQATVDAPDGSGPIGTFLAVRELGPKRLVGSGHPDEPGRLAPFLGLISSEDGGRTWRSVSRYGLSDLHVLRPAHRRLYVADAVLGGVLIGDPAGREWIERSAPPGIVLDLVVNPTDPDEMVISHEDRIISSTDGGRSWQPLIGADRPRLAWPAAETLYRADLTGRVFESGDHGSSWSLVGLIDGEPWKLEAVGNEHLFAALADAAIVESTDGGRSWEEVFSP